MKKFFSFFAALLFAGSMMAAEPYTLKFNYFDNAGSDKGQAETKLSGLFDAASLDYVDTTAATTLENVYLGRKYKDAASGDSIFSNIKFGTSSKAGTLKFALKNMAVDSVVFRAAMYGKSEGTDGFTVNGTAFTLSAGNKVFENVTYVPSGNITALEIVQAKASSGRFYLTSITVYPKSGVVPPAVATPVISGEAVFTDSVIVTMTCSTQDADIYYTTDGTTDPKCDCAAAPEYKKPIVIKATTTIMAAAYTGNDWSAVATKTFTKKEPLVAISCAEVYNKAKGTELALNNVTVAYANGKNVYVQDATGSMLLYLANSTTWTAGNILSGVEGTLDIYNDLYEVKMTDAQATAVQPGQGEAPAPAVFTAAPVAADMNKYIVLKNVKVDSITFPSNKNLNATIGDQTFVLRNNFNADVAFDTTKLYDITGVVSVYKGAVQVYFINATEAAAPVLNTYTVAGSPATLFGTAWDPTNAANDMKPITGSKYLYAWEKDSVALTAGDIEFKVCENHAWTKAWPAQNYKLNIAEAGLYKVSIFFNPEFADSVAVYATAEKKGEAKVLPNIIMHGNFTGSWADTEAFTPAADSLTASLTLALAEGTYEFGFKFDGTWKANGATITREANTANLSTGSGNMHITADVPGNYIFTYTYETEGLVVTYPEPIIVPDTVKIVVKEDLEWTDAVAAEGWWQIMGENEGYSFSLSNVSTTEVPGIYTVMDLDYDYSYVKPINGTDKIHFVSGQVVVAINTDSIITFVGALTGTDNKVYAFDLVYDPAAVNPYKYDEKDADFIYNFDSYELDAKYVSQGVMMISAQTDTTSLGLIVYLPQGQTTLVAGEYPVAATPAYQTVVAGYYDAEYAFSGSMAATLIEQGGKLYYNQIWYLVSGKATVDANLNITVDALNSNSKLIKANLKAKAQGVEDVEAAVKATKSLQNGILVIEKNGVKYNVTGLQIR